MEMEGDKTNELLKKLKVSLAMATEDFRRWSSQ